MGAAHPAPSRGKREGRTRGAGAGNAQESPAVRGAGLARGQRRARCLSHARRLDCDGHPARSSTPDWVVPQDSEVFAESFATALAALHAVPISAAVDAGMLIRTPTQARQKVADDVDRVRREFVVNDKRLHRWQRWLDDDSSWPDFSVVVHGDLYVGHVLHRQHGARQRMIDWARPRVTTLPSTWPRTLWSLVKGLAKLLLTYEAAGGRVWPRARPPHRGAPCVQGGHLRTSPSTRVTKSTSLREGAARRSGMSERRYSPLATLFAATFLFRIGNAVAAPRFHGSSCLIQRARPGGRHGR